MNKIIFILFGLLLTDDLLSQGLITIDSNTLCLQIENSIAYLKKQKGLKRFNFKAERSTRYGDDYAYTTDWDYIEENLGYRRDSIYYYIQNKKIEESIIAVLDFLHNPHDTVILEIKCQGLIFDTNSTNTIISKIDNQTLIINLQTEFHRPSGSHAGLIFLFFFNNEQQIKTVKKYKWIE